MAADGSIVIDTRVNNRGAEADLKALQSKAKSTANQIAALDKEISQATGKRSKLADDLAAARKEADATAQAWYKAQAAIRERQSGKYGGVDQSWMDKQQAEADKLEAAMQRQDAKADAIHQKYLAQEAALDRMNRQHSALVTQLEREQAAAAGQAEALQKAKEQQQRALQFQSGDNAMQAYFAKQSAAVEKQYAKAEARQNKMLGVDTSATQRAETIVRETQREIAAQEKAAQAAEDCAAREAAAVNSLQSQINTADVAKNLFSRALSSLASFGSKAFGVVQRQIGKVGERLKAAGKSLRSFNTRLAGIVSGALIFNLISAGLRNMTSYMGQALTATASLRTALGNLQGTASTAAMQLVQILSPALTVLANAAATLFSYLSRLIAFFTGKTVSASAAAAAGVAGVGSAASDTAKEVKEATRSLAGFDEIERLDAPQQTPSSGGGGGGGGGSAIVPDYGFQGESPFLDEILDAIEAGDWYQVGALIGEKLRDSLNAIPWPQIQDKVQTWVQNLADTINGFIETPGLWESIGHTFAQGLNTITTAITTFEAGVHWESLGAGVANGLTTAVREIHWDDLGLALTAGVRIALGTLHGFVTTYTGWEELGQSISTMLKSAFGSIEWVQAAEDLGNLAVGILEMINEVLKNIEWDEVGKTILDMLKAIPWQELFTQLFTLLSQIWPVVAAAILLPLVSSWIVGTLLPAALTALATLISGVVSAIGAWPVLLLAALAVVAAAIRDFLIENWDSISAWFQNAWNTFLQGWNNFWQSVGAAAQQWWGNVTSDWINFWTGLQQKLSSAGAALQQVWSSIWTGISDFVGGVWDGILQTIRQAINSIIGLINSMISAVVNGINGVIDLLNSFSFDVPDFAQDVLGTSKVGFNISHITAPQIPALAQGAVIPPNREFLAVLGDQSHGTNIEAPLATIEQAVANVMEDLLGGQMAGFEAVTSVLREILEAVYGIEIGDEQIGRAMQRYDSRRARMTGGI